MPVDVMYVQVIMRQETYLGSTLPIDGSVLVTSDGVTPTLGHSCTSHRVAYGRGEVWIGLTTGTILGAYLD